MKLTRAGKALAERANSLIKESNHLVQKIQNIGADQQIIRVGTSTINPASEIRPYLAAALRKLSAYEIQYIPLETLNALFPRFYQELGQEVDIMFGPSGFASTKEKTKFIKLKDMSFQLAMHSTDPLAQKAAISLKDLSGKTVTLPPYHSSEIIDHFYDLVREKRLPINLKATDRHYSISTFNKFVQEGSYLWSLPCWDHVLPGLVNRAVKLDLNIPYGIMTPLKPNPAVRKFVQVLTQTIAAKKKQK